MSGDDERHREEATLPEERSEDEESPETRPRVQRAQPGPGDEERADADPDRPTDQVWQGNVLGEPAPGD